MNLTPEWLREFNPAQREDALRKAVRLPKHEGIYITDADSGLVIVNRQDARSDEPNPTTREEKLLNNIFGYRFRPLPFVERRFYTPSLK